jgi:hypothetical protein
MNGRLSQRRRDVIFVEHDLGVIQRIGYSLERLDDFIFLSAVQDSVRFHLDVFVFVISVIMLLHFPDRKSVV